MSDVVEEFRSKTELPVDDWWKNVKNHNSSVQVLDVKYSTEMRLNEFKHLKDLRLVLVRNDFLNFLNQLSNLSTVEKILIKVEWNGIDIVSATMITTFIKKLPASVEDFSLELPVDAYFERDRIEDMMIPEQHNFFAKFLQNVFGEMHMKFNLPVVRNALPAVQILDLDEPFETLTRIGFINGNFFFQFVEGLYKIQTDPFQFVQPPLPEQLDFVFGNSVLE